jgi:hypothetical protein
MVQTLHPASGTIPLSATPLPGFILGVWHNTSGDHGSGDPGTIVGNTSSTTVVVPAGVDTCVWICCPEPSGSGCPDPTTMDPCP